MSDSESEPMEILESILSFFNSFADDYSCERIKSPQDIIYSNIPYQLLKHSIYDVFSWENNELEQDMSSEILEIYIHTYLNELYNAYQILHGISVPSSYIVDPVSLCGDNLSLVSLLNLSGLIVALILSGSIKTEAVEHVYNLSEDDQHRLMIVSADLLSSDSDLAFNTDESTYNSPHTSESTNSSHYSPHSMVNDGHNESYYDHHNSSQNSDYPHLNTSMFGDGSGNLDGHLEDSLNELYLLRAERQDLENALENKETAFNKLRKEYDEATRSHVKALEALEERHRSHSELLNSQLADVTAAMQNKDSVDVARLQADALQLSSSLENLQSEFDSMKSAYEGELSSANEEILRLRLSVDDLQTNIDSLTQELLEKNEDCQRLQSRVDEWGEKMRETDVLLAEVDSLKRNNVKLSRTVNSLTKYEGKSKEQAGELIKLQMELDGLRVRMKHDEEVLGKLKTALKKGEEEGRSNRKMVSELKNEIEKLESQVSTLTIQLEEEKNNSKDREERGGDGHDSGEEGVSVIDLEIEIEGLKSQVDILRQSLREKDQELLTLRDSDLHSVLNSEDTQDFSSTGVDVDVKMSEKIKELETTLAALELDRNTWKETAEKTQNDLIDRDLELEELRDEFEKEKEELSESLRLEWSSAVGAKACETEYQADLVNDRDNSIIKLKDEILREKEEKEQINASLTEKLTLLESELAEKNKKISDLENYAQKTVEEQITVENSSVKDISELEAELSELQGKILLMTVEMDTLKHDHTDSLALLQDQLKSSETALSSANSLTNELEMEVEVLTRERDSLRVDLQRVDGVCSALKGETQNLLNKNQTLEKQKEDVDKKLKTEKDAVILLRKQLDSTIKMRVGRAEAGEGENVENLLDAQKNLFAAREQIGTLESSVKHLEEEHDSLLSTLSELEEELSTITEERNAMKQTVTGLEVEVEMLRRDSELHQANADMFRQEASESISLRESLREAEADRDKLSEETRAFFVQVRTLSAKLEPTEMERNMYKGRVLVLENELDTLRSEYEMVVRDNVKLQVDGSGVEDEIKSIAAERKEAQAEAVAQKVLAEKEKGERIAIEHQCLSLKQEIENLTSQLAAVNKQLNEYKVENVKLAEELLEVKATAGHGNNYGNMAENEVINRLTQELEVKENIISNLHNQLSTLSASSNASVSADPNDTSQSNLQNPSSPSHTNSTSQIQLDKLQNQVSVMEVERDRLASDNTRLRSNVERLTKKVADTEEMYKQLSNTLENEKNSREVGMQGLREEVLLRERELSRVKAELTRTERKLSDISQNTGLYSKTMGGLVGSRKMTDNEAMVLLERDVERLLDRVEAVEGERETAIQERDRISANIRETELKTTHLSEDLARLRSEYETLKNTHTRTLSELETETQKKDKFEKYVLQSARNVKEAETKNTRALQVNAKLMASLSALRDERNLLENELVEQERRVMEYALVAKREQKLLATAFYEIGSEFAQNVTQRAIGGRGESHDNWLQRHRLNQNYDEFM